MLWCSAFLSVAFISFFISGCAGNLAPFSNTASPSPSPAATVAVVANPTSISAGTSSTLTITATHATQITITGTDSSSYTMQSTGGTQSVTPKVTTTYTVTAIGAGGNATATTTVTVVPPGPPTVLITASPVSITAGGSSTLTVSATNATQVTVIGTDGSSYTLPANGGMQVVSPSVTTTYQATTSGAGGNISASVIVTVIPSPAATVTMTANPISITAGNASMLSVTATNATQVTVTGTDGSNYPLQPSGGTQSVSPATTTTYTATATGTAGNVTAAATLTVVPAGTVQAVDHVIFMLQENHTFDNYFGMLNPYRVTNGWNVGDYGKTYTVDGIDDKLATISNTNDNSIVYSPFKFKTTCVDDMSSAWLASYGDVNTYDFSSTRQILMDGFVHNAEGYANTCTPSTCSGAFTDTNGQRAMGYYDDGFLNYYYYMATQFALSDRWFSPVSSKSIDNRIATFTGGTTQGLVKDPGNDGLPQLAINSIFEELDKAPTPVSWKIYYTVTRGYCMAGTVCPGGGANNYPATNFSTLSYSYRYLYENPNGNPCTGTTQGSAVVGDPSNSFCIDPNHIAPLSVYFTDLTNNTLPSFAFIEAGYANNDEHPGSGQPVLFGQAQVANIVNKLMVSPSWKDSVFFLSYDEGGGPYDHVPPVAGHSNDYTDAALIPSIPDIGGIAVSPDSYNPCVPSGGTTPTLHCDLAAGDPGATSTDAAAMQGFGAQLGFRLPNMVISPFTRRHYVSHIPMDHTAVIRFVEDRFIGNSIYLTKRDAAQPTLLDFFDFTNVPWATPPAPPTPYADSGASCTPASM